MSTDHKGRALDVGPMAQARPLGSKVRPQGQPVSDPGLKAPPIKMIRHTFTRNVTDKTDVHAEANDGDDALKSKSTHRSAMMHRPNGSVRLITLFVLLYNQPDGNKRLERDRSEGTTTSNICSDPCCQSIMFTFCFFFSPHDPLAHPQVRHQPNTTLQNEVPTRWDPMKEILAEGPMAPCLIWLGHPW